MNSGFAFPQGNSSLIASISTSDDFRALARRTLNFSPDQQDGDYNQDESVRDYILATAKRPAAVLIGIVERESGLHVILTQRTRDLPSHSGQVAFPGGKIDPQDEDEFAAALRESEEEIGLERSFVEVMGRLPDYQTGSGFIIAPVIGLVDQRAELVPEPGEVEYIFEVPLEFLMNPDNHQRGSRLFQGTRRYYLEMPYGEHYIWGVTAGIIRAMYQRMFVR